MTNTAQSSVCGIGLGAENCYVAVARQGGIEIILNEYSQYSTPAYIGLGGNQRDLGTSAKQKQMTHLRSTCFAPSLLLGKKYSELDLKSIPYAVEEGPNDSILLRVDHAGEELVLTPTQLLAMIFTKLRHIGGNPVDCVINCPNFFNEIQRRQMLDAAQIAGLNPLKIINDTTAVALFHGFYRTPNNRDSSIVCFFDCGQSSSQSSIYFFNHKENSLNLLDTQYQAEIGGRDFDQLIANHFIQEQKLELNNRARYRLYAECEKLKKQMSANSNELPISIECLHNDRDFSARMDREKFLEISGPLFAKLQGMLSRNLDCAKLKYDKLFAEKFGDFKISSVEIFGGSSRIPEIKRIVKAVFDIEPSTTLNADEAVARGCALQCAILSPNFKTNKSLNMLDGISYQINFGFDADGDNKELKWVKFDRGTVFPITKKITGSCKKFPIRVAIQYVNQKGEIIPSSEYLIDQPAGQDLSHLLEKNQVIFRLRFDHNGLASVSSASISYEKPPEAEPEQMEVAGEAPVEKMEVEESAEKKKKPKSITVDLDVKPVLIEGHLSLKGLQQVSELEANLVLADKNWKEKTDAKNALEEFIYEWKEKLSTLEAFISSSEKESFSSLLEENENWLYEQDDNDIMHSRSVYDERTNRMKNDFANKILHRKREFEMKPSVLASLGQTLQQANKFIETAEEAEKETVEQLRKIISEKQEYFELTQGKSQNWNTTECPPFSCEDIRQNTSTLQSSLTSAQNARKRIHEQRRKAAEEAAKKAADEAKKAEEDAKKAAAQAAEEPVIDEEVDKKGLKTDEVSGDSNNANQMDID